METPEPIARQSARLMIIGVVLILGGVLCFYHRDEVAIRAFGGCAVTQVPWGISPTQVCSGPKPGAVFQTELVASVGILLGAFFIIRGSKMKSA
jgi:hypothetical protein